MLSASEAALRRTVVHPFLDVTVNGWEAVVDRVMASIQNAFSVSDSAA
jgi:hypothetical protein